MSRTFILAIDQGTTGTTALMLDEDLEVRGKGYQEIPQSYPAPGWVEHDPEEIWRSVLAAVSAARGRAGEGAIAGIGITNQRETVVCWDRATGQAVAPAIVWQDRRTADHCAALRTAGLEYAFQRRTGLLLDPYFSGTKIAWLLDNVPGLRPRAEAGTVAFGTIDSFLVWRLTGGKSHLTDVSNASRTLLLNLDTLAWDAELCRLLAVPAAALPRVVASSGKLATTLGVDGIPDGTRISGIAGDQQAALFGQNCLRPGDAKCTFGTGSFLLMNVGGKPVTSKHRLIATVAWQVAFRTTYALEGSAFVSGALVQWLRDGLHIIKNAADIEGLALSVPDAGGVTIVPALAGLGAPHWRPEARGIIAGLSRGTTAAHIARAALEAMALQNVDLVRAMEQDAGHAITSLRVDGGAAANDLLMQLQADVLGADIVRPAMVESTALGAGRLAAQGLGLRSSRASKPDTGASVFRPRITPAEREQHMTRWRDAMTECDVTFTTKTIPDGSHQFSPVSLRLEAAAATHAGQVREANEDVFGIYPEERLFVVADGMGGRAAGEVAARLAVDALEAFCRENHDSAPETWPFALDPRFSRPVNLLRVGLKVANQAIREEARKDPSWFRMGATIAALTFDEDHLVAAHAGDVRVYRIRNGHPSRLTRDHSLFEELQSARPSIPAQELAALGNRNVITRSLGSKPDLEPTVYLNAYADGDLYLLCTDGLWDCVPDDRVTGIILAHADVELACHALIDEANAAGGPDNVTALVVRVSR